MRFGKAKSGNTVSDLSLHSPFTIFAYDSRPSVPAMRPHERYGPFFPTTATKQSSMKAYTAISFALAAAALLCAATLHARTDRPARYYVAADGDDAAKGSLRRPFRTINRALRQARAGDTVFVRGGTYREQVVFPSSGRPDARIVLMAYRGERAVVSGEGTDVEGRTDMLLIRGRSHITVEGLEIADLCTTEAGREANGIVVEAGSSDITLRGNHIHSIRNAARRETYPSAHAILVIGNTEQAVRRIAVEGNRIHDCVTGTSEAVTVNGYVDGFRIGGNEIFRCSNIAIDAAGGYAANPDPTRNYARNGVICGNTIYDIDNELGQLKDNCGAIAIYADGARGIVIERNRIHRCDRGIGIVSETDAYPTVGCVVRNNIVTSCRRTGIYMGGYLDYTGGGTERCAIVNNTLVGNNLRPGAFGETEGELRLTENCRDNTVANNLVCTASADDLFVHKYTATGHGNRFERNLYSGPAGWLWQQRDGEPLRDIETWREASGGDAEAIHIHRPIFDFEPQLDSDFTPAGEAAAEGVILDGSLNGEYDFAGNPRTDGGKTAIGALQPQKPTTR